MQLRGESEQERHAGRELQHNRNLQNHRSTTERAWCEKGEGCRVPERNRPVGEPQEWTHQYRRPGSAYSVPSRTRRANGSSETRHHNNGRKGTLQYRSSPLCNGPAEEQSGEEGCSEGLEECI